MKKSLSDYINESERESIVEKKDMSKLSYDEWVLRMRKAVNWLRPVMKKASLYLANDETDKYDELMEKESVIERLQEYHNLTLNFKFMIRYSDEKGSVVIHHTNGKLNNF